MQQKKGKILFRYLKKCICNINGRWSIFFFFIFIITDIQDGKAQTPITIQLPSVKDNTIYQRNTSNSNGAGEFMIAGTTGSPYFNHALIMFDIAGSIPAGAKIQSASLTLHLAGTSGNSGPFAIEMHKLLQDWGEGSSNAGTQAGLGAPATASDATWVNNFYPSSTWPSAGGNYQTGVSATQTIAGIGFYTWSSSDLVVEIQGWLNSPSTNFGWLLKSNELSSFQAKKFESRENPVAANRPLLMVTYVPNIPPAISIISPANNSSYKAGDLITLDVSAADADGFIRKVEFFNQGFKFLEDSLLPYGLISNEAEPGQYVLTARATDNYGVSSGSDTVRITISSCAGTGATSGEGYTNIPGSQVANLTANAAYPNNPSISAQLPVFEYAGVGDNYGGRVRGYICAPQTGSYTFYIAGDDQAGLWLSADENPEHKTLIAYNEFPVSFRDWTKYPTQKSSPRKLIKGARYYIETLHKQSTGSNHLSVAWILPDGTGERPIPGNRLSPWLSGSGGGSDKEFSKEMTNLNPTGFRATIGPNPSEDQFTLTTISNLGTMVTIRVADVTGRVVEKRNNIPVNGTFQFGTGLKPGVYFVEISQGAQKQNFKLVKQ